MTSRATRRGIRPQILVGSILSGVGAYVSVRFLTRYFETRSLRPFGIYCIVAGLPCLAWFHRPSSAWVAIERQTVVLDGSSASWLNWIERGFAALRH